VACLGCRPPAPATPCCVCIQQLGRGCWGGGCAERSAIFFFLSLLYRRGEPSSAGHGLCERGVLARGKGCAVGAEENTPVCGRSQKGRHQPSPKPPEALGSPDRLGRYDGARTCIQGRSARAMGGRDEVAHAAARVTQAQKTSAKVPGDS
jgi:hypothetical protein